MKKIVIAVYIILFFLIAGFGYWFFTSGRSAAKQGTEGGGGNVIVAKKHSGEFNSKVDAAIASYLSMKDAFVEWDSTLAKSKANEFTVKVAEIPLDELSEDKQEIISSARQQISDIQANSTSVGKGKNLEEMRHDFYMISENLYPFLKTIGYEGEKLYWENCPMAFGEDQGANWLSDSRRISNPYLGKHHPVYKGAMVSCGEVMDSIYAR